MTPENHFERPADAAADGLLQQCVHQGWVPPGCVLGGELVMVLMNAGRDPCAGCRGPRHRCGGRPFTDFEQTSAQGVRSAFGRNVDRDRAKRVRAFFLGGDTAPSESHRSDDGSLVVGLATPRDPGLTWETLSDNEADWHFDFVRARTLTSVEKASARQWSALMHQWHQLYSFEKILLDPGGGGIFVARELKSQRQIINGAEQDVTPIADQVNGPREVSRGYFILHLYKRGDPGIELLWPGLAGDDKLNDAAYSEMKSAVDTGGVSWPARLEDLRRDNPEALKGWTPERFGALDALNRTVDQFKNVSVVTMEGPDGPQFAMTRRGARQFTATGKKDLMSGSMYCYLAFRIWLRSEDWKSGIRPGSRALFSGA